MVKQNGTQSGKRKWHTNFTCIHGRWETLRQRAHLSIWVPNCARSREPQPEEHLLLVVHLFKILFWPLPWGAGKKLRYGSFNYPANRALHFLRPNFLFPRHIGPWQIGPSKLSPQTEMEKREKLERCKFLPKNSTKHRKNCETALFNVWIVENVF